MSAWFSLLAALFSMCGAQCIAATSPLCAPAEMQVTPDEYGFVGIHRTNGDVASIYWAKIRAKSVKPRGTVFYLAGGPLPHFVYLNLAAAFQEKAYSNFDVVVYDYFGINCSSAIQTFSELHQNASYLTVTQMAADFVALKRELIGNQKAVTMGGSHGAMLGAQILADFPQEIAKAILFSGDTETGWLANGWLKFDGLLQKFAGDHATFAGNFSRLEERAERGDLTVSYNGSLIKLGRKEFEVSVWLTFGQDSRAQGELAEAVQQAVDGDTSWLAGAYAAYKGVLAPVAAESTPTYQTTVTNFHRCNVWLPKSKRKAALAENYRLKFLHFDSLVNYWDQLCADYDRFGEYAFSATATKPAAIPVLSWLGDQDYFDLDKTKARWSMLTSDLRFHVMPGWSHDFGPDTANGFEHVAGLVKAFMAE